MTRPESLYLINANGVQIGSPGTAIPDGKLGENGSIVQTLAAGTYYVEIPSGGTLTIPDQSAYSLSLWTGTPTIGTFAFDGAGNFLANARNVGTLASTAVTFADWVGPTDNDYYQFSVGSVSSVDLQLSGLAQTAVADAARCGRQYHYEQNRIGDHVRFDRR